MLWLSELEDIAKNKLKLNEDLKNHTSWKIGGKATAIIEPQCVEVLLPILDFIAKNSIPYFILGGGTNLLVHDSGFDGIVISTKKLKKIDKISDTIFVFEAGVLVADILKITLCNGLSGWEHMVGIPGTLGGALVGNAGVNGYSAGNSVVWVERIEKNLSVKKLIDKDIKWAYRESIPLNDGSFITKACLKFTKSNKSTITENINFFKLKRSSQPKHGYSAGSVFKNANNREFAGFLLDKYGCKGLCCGNARISVDHANFILNDGNASSRDVWNLIQQCRNIVLYRHGKWLDLEVKLIGEPWT
ncbi:UDP-N-acetylmuramate dehydrogenase [Aminithiophilus ramosus]|uniref:UDP-N-acetylenolpyruvoylglucosamine reductase n=2 Tax=Synergistales TaxID=649776 RepID=A0A9Q7AQX4_9BACT|nr:UDP-N-acetylmuramate dehydrogenase [Aminithiophilus ramosus]QTX33538.1 UDP-N-acetylmuramate dehydrogenase [Aminithiophilus ramosus]QVL37393.1 UDP-N-acetylmuramate dehydrogenase [Synergistota bacterium]